MELLLDNWWIPVSLIGIFLIPSAIFFVAMEWMTKGVWQCDACGEYTDCADRIESEPERCRFCGSDRGEV